jgi:Ni/Co efflux regulator RcnB
MDDDRKTEKQEADEIRTDHETEDLSRRALFDRLAVLGVGFGVAYASGIKGAQAREDDDRGRRRRRDNDRDDDDDRDERDDRDRRRGGRERGRIPQTLTERLVGAWTFVSAVDTNKDGAKSDRWGPNAKGLAIFNEKGRFSFMISRADIPKFASDTVNEGTAEENKTVVQGMIVMVGTWSIDEASKTLITNIEASSFPNLNGKSQKRIIHSLTADELKYNNPATTTGANTEAVWKRAE